MKNRTQSEKHGDDIAQRDEDAAIALSALMRAYKDPHALYDAARKQDGICFDPVGKCWIVTNDAAARTILNDSRFCSALSGDGAGGPAPAYTLFVQAAVKKQFLFSDGEQHRRLHQATLRVSADRMQQIAPMVRRIAHELLAAAKRKGEMDLVRDFALPFSLETICLVMGVPLGDAEQRDHLARWSTAHNNLTSGYPLVRLQEIVQLGDHFRDLITRKREAPSDDLIGTFLKQNVFENDEDLIINCMMIFAAGRVTTQKLLGDGVPLLMPSWETLRNAIGQRPGVSKHLTEELLRVVTPTRYLARYAVQDVDMSEEFPGDHRIRKGDRIIVYLEAANHDPQSFVDAHCVVPERQPNSHLAFGHGSHRCPGEAAARLEIQIALEALFHTFSDLRPHPTIPPTWDPNPNLGGFASYPCLCA